MDLYLDGQRSRKKEIGEKVKLPTFIGRLIASWKALRSYECGGILANWNNGQFDILCRWNTDAGLESAWELVENHLASGRDEIYIAVVFQGNPKGYITIHEPNHFHIPIAFWGDYYSFDEAFRLMAKHCREIGTKMGYRNPEEK